MLEHEFPGYSADELARQFGRGFADGLASLEPGVWHAPVLSGYGVHVVRIGEVIVPPPPALDDVADRVRADWIQSQRDTLNAQYKENLLAAYQIEVEEVSVPLLVPGGGASELEETARMPTGNAAAEGGF